VNKRLIFLITYHHLLFYRLKMRVQNRPTASDHHYCEALPLPFLPDTAIYPYLSNVAFVCQHLHLLLSSWNIMLTSLDFSKAFDTVWHETLLRKLAHLTISDCVYIWVVDFFGGGGTRIKFRELTSVFWLLLLLSFRVRLSARLSSSLALPTWLQSNHAIFWPNVPTIAYVS